MANIQRLKTLIAESGIDALILAGRKNTLYLRSNLLFRDAMYNSTNDGWILMLCVIAPPDNSFTVGARGLNLPGLPAETYGTDDYLHDYLAVVIEQLKNRNLHRGRIGLDAGLAPGMMFALQDGLPDARFEDAESLMVRTRTVKTPREIACMRKAVHIAEQAFEDARDEMRRAKSWSAAGRAVARAVLNLGAAPHQINPFDFICTDFEHSPILNQAPAQGSTPDAMGWEPEGLTRWPAPQASPRDVGTTRLDWNICYQGYVSDFKLPLCFKEPPLKAVETVNAHVQRVAFMYDVVRPGKTKREVYDACRREFGAEKTDAPLWLIHGVGMDVHEEPRMSSAYPTGHERIAPEIVFEEGNVLSLEGSWLVEELAVLERDGPKRIGSANTRAINVV